MTSFKSTYQYHALKNDVNRNRDVFKKIIDDPTTKKEIKVLRAQNQTIGFGRKCTIELPKLGQIIRNPWFNITISGINQKVAEIIKHRILDMVDLQINKVRIDRHHFHTRPVLESLYHKHTQIKCIDRFVYQFHIPVLFDPFNGTNALPFSILSHVEITFETIGLMTLYKILSKENLSNHVDSGMPVLPILIDCFLEIDYYNVINPEYLYDYMMPNHFKHLKYGQYKNKNISMITKHSGFYGSELLDIHDDNTILMLHFDNPIYCMFFCFYDIGSNRPLKLITNNILDSVVLEMGKEPHQVHEKISSQNLLKNNWKYIGTGIGDRCSSFGGPKCHTTKDKSYDCVFPQTVNYPMFPKQVWQHFLGKYWKTNPNIFKVCQATWKFANNFTPIKPIPGYYMIPMKENYGGANDNANDYPQKELCFYDNSSHGAFQNINASAIISEMYLKLNFKKDIGHTSLLCNISTIYFDVLQIENGTTKIIQT